MRRTTTALLLVIPLFSISCGSPAAPLPFLASTPGPTPTVYTGTVVDSSSGTGAINVSLVTVEGIVSGTWNTTFGGKPSVTKYITGTEIGANYSATVSVCPETDQGTGCTNCRWLFSGSLTPSSLAGTYSTVSNPACQPESGSVSASH